LKRYGTRAETRFRLSPKRMSSFKLAEVSVQSTAGSRGVRISVSNAGYTTFRGSLRVMATHSIRQFPLHFPSRASPCAIRFQKHSTTRTAGFGYLFGLYKRQNSVVLIRIMVTVKIGNEATVKYFNLPSRYSPISSRWSASS